MSERIFLPAADQNFITVTRGDKFSLKLTPSEVNKATELIGDALRMETMDSLPDHITNTPFVIRFFEDNKLALERRDEEGSIPFDWNEADELIVTFGDGLKIALNERSVVKGPRGVGYTSINEEPFV